MTTKTFVDPEAAAKAWARGQGLACGQRVFLGVNNGAAFPQLVVGRAGGQPDFGEPPLDRPVISFSAWAENRAQAAALAYAVQSAAESMTGPTPMGAAAVGHGARTLTGPLYRTSDADEKAGRYRYLLDIELVIRAA